MTRRIIAAAVAALALTAAAGAQSASAATIPGDVNGDCLVTTIDLQIVANNYGYSYGSLRYRAAYDVDGNRTIDIRDLQFIAARHGNTC
jgi:hypothetical protein